MRLEAEVQMCTNQRKFAEILLKETGSHRFPGNHYLKSSRDNENNMSAGGKKNVKVELCQLEIKAVSAALVIILRGPHSRSCPRSFPGAPVCLRTHTRSHTCTYRGWGGVSASTSGQPAGESPFLDKDALFQEQALTSACD